MYLEIYPDIVFILNFCIDFILLVLVKAVNQKRCGLLRLSCAAMIGGGAAVLISLIPWLNSMTNIFPSLILLKVFSGMVKLAAIPFMLRVAFGKMRWTDLLKQGISFFLITFVVGGLMSSIYYHTRLRFILLNLGDTIMLSNISGNFIALTMIIIVALAFGLLYLRKIYQHRKKDIYDVELIIERHSFKTKGLFDTGNCLYDPLYHRPVIVIEHSVLRELFSEEFLDEYEKTKRYLSGVTPEEEVAVSIEQSDTMKRLLKRFRIIPYSSIGKEQGMMFGLTLDQLIVNTGRETICCNKITAAVADNQLSPGEEYQVILHKELLYT